jgi:tetratricopeptide (TPR) repeat protein/predicted Ser/Thr protein kinase
VAAPVAQERSGEVTPERWQEVKKVLAEALEKEPADRAAYLDQVCTDASLRREVDSLIVAHNQGDSTLLERLAVEPENSEGLKIGSRLGSYEILARIGAGGMGVVYSALDSKLKRQVAIKVLPGAVAHDADRLARFEREAQVLASLNHPNIATIYGLDRAGDVDFLVMELIEGKTLAELSANLSNAEKLSIIRQIAEGLEAAHEKGVIHRDLKPANVKITPEGRVKVLDFGLAKALAGDQGVDLTQGPTISAAATEPGMILGTPAYMSPEQARGKPVDKRTDVWAFGCVVYELYSKRRAFAGATVADTIAAVLEREPNWQALPASTPVKIQDLLHKCLQKDPQQRLRDLGDARLEIELMQAKPAHPAFHRWLAVGAGVVVAAVALSGGGYLYFHRPGKVTSKDSIVVADFTNTTGDPVFDGALRQGLSIQLEQTPFFTLVPGDQIVQTLRMMERPTDAPLTPPVAREVCQRMNATVEVDGSIAPLGSQYVLGLNALNCWTGETLAQEQVSADGKEKVLSSLSNAASQLRSKLGESRASLATYDVPLTRATTSSLEALQAYTQGNQAFWSADLESAISSLERAIQIDPNFATAYSALGPVRAQLGDTNGADKSITKAYELRDRTNAYEKLSIPAIYYFQVVRDYDKAAALYDEWAETFPREAEAWIGLGICYNYAGQPDQGLRAVLEALRLRPSAFSYGLIALNYTSLNRFDEARTTIAKARELHIEPFLAPSTLYEIGFVTGNPAEVAEQQALPWPGMAPGTREDNIGDTAAYSGHLASARDWTRRAIALAESAKSEDTAAGFHAESAVREALFGNFSQARSEARQGEDPSLDVDERGLSAVALALAGDEEAKKIADDLIRRFPDSSYQRYVFTPVVRAALALHHGNSQEAIESLEIPAPYDLVSPTAPVYLRGEAYLLQHKGTEAAAEFQKILDHPGLIGNALPGALARLELGRAYVLAGDTARARAAYLNFLTLWKDADPDIPILVQAKAEYAKLK